jgi:hypothetical protein
LIVRIEDGRFGKGAALSSATASQSADSAGHAKSPSPDSRGGGRDSVTTSDLSNLLSRVGARADADRAATINRLAEQYRAGKYVLDNTAIGEALFAHAFGE